MASYSFLQIGDTPFGSTDIKEWQIEVQQPNTTCINPHCHDRMEILHIVQGSMNMTVGGLPFVAEAGSIVIANPKQMHYGISSTEGLIYDVVVFDVGALYNNVPSVQQYLLPLVQGLIQFTPHSTNTIVADCVTNLITALRKKEHTLIVISRIYEVLGCLYQHCLTEAASLPTQANDRFKEVLEYINNHYTESISAKSVSQLFNYSEAYFCRQFKKEMGLTLSSYLRLLRIERAQQLLKQPELSIAQVAQLSGFSDCGYFCRCFQKHFQRTPTEMRNYMLTPQ